MRIRVTKGKCQGKTRKDGARPALFHCICVVRLLFVLFYLLFVCKCVLPLGDDPIAVNKRTKFQEGAETERVRSKIKESEMRGR